MKIVHKSGVFWGGFSDKLVCGVYLSVCVVDFLKGIGILKSFLVALCFMLRPLRVTPQDTHSDQLVAGFHVRSVFPSGFRIIGGGHSLEGCHQDVTCGPLCIFVVTSGTTGT